MDVWTSGQRDHKGDKGLSQIAAPLAGREWVHEQCHVIMFRNMFELSVENRLVHCLLTDVEVQLSDWKSMLHD